jgi:AcrR family transcriptional regulator
MTGEISLRERKKQETRQAIQVAALELFETKGYDATTIDDIVERANYSRRTFFRHFTSKDDVVFADVPERVEWLRSELAARRPSKDPVGDVREVLTEAARSFVQEHAHRSYSDAWRQEPALWNRYIRLVVEWEEGLEEFFEEELRDHPNGAVLAPVLAISMCGVIRAALTERYKWDDLDDALDVGFDALERGLGDLRAPKGV